MFTLKEESSCEYEIKKSKFIAYLVSFELFEKRLKELKEAHPKARHFVTASRSFNEHDQIIESSSDDGEPRGTSGKPTLKVLQGNDLINVAMITVRYFGGIKLGPGGLVRAYSDSANLAVGEAELIEYIKPYKKEIVVGYSDMSRLEYLAGLDDDVTISDKRFEPMRVVVTLCGRESSVTGIASKM